MVSLRHPAIVLVSAVILTGCLGPAPTNIPEAEDVGSMMPGSHIHRGFQDQPAPPLTYSYLTVVVPVSAMDDPKTLLNAVAEANIQTHINLSISADKAELSSSTVNTELGNVTGSWTRGTCSNNPTQTDCQSEGKGEQGTCQSPFDRDPDSETISLEECLNRALSVSGLRITTGESSWAALEFELDTGNLVFEQRVRQRVLDSPNDSDPLYIFRSDDHLIATNALGAVYWIAVRNGVEANVAYRPEIAWPDGG